MTINLVDNNPRIAYSLAPSIGQQVFAVPFEFFNDLDLSVFVDGVLKTQGTHYTLTGGDGSTGTVVFVAPIVGGVNGSIIVISRTMPIERTTDFSSGSDINRAALNEQLDILTAMTADSKDRIDRTIRSNPHEIAPNMILPTVASRKGKVLAFDLSTGDVINGPTINAVVNAEALAAASAASAAASAASAAAALGSQNSATSSQVASAVSAAASAASAAASAASAANKVEKTSNTGAAQIPAGTLAERDASPAAGYFRFNTTAGKFEGHTGSAWGSVGGGATGGGSDEVFVETATVVTTNYTITSAKNAMSAGPLTINSGVIITIPSGSVWTIV